MKEWMRSTTRDLELYYNPKVTAVRMDTSTNVLGANPAASRLLAEGMEIDLNQYPNTYSDGLRGELADFYSLEADNFIAGNGSDEILDILFKTFLEFGETVVAPYPTYTLHDFFVKINGGRMEFVDLTEDFQLDVEGMLSTEGKMLILCTPNNPTANSFRKEDVIALLEGFDGPVVVDEAYAEYCGRSMVPFVNDYENLIVTRTFSKAYALAGLRVGYCVSNDELQDMMMRVKIPYSLNVISERTAIAALRDQDFIRRSVEMVDRNRPKLIDGLKRLGFTPYPSDSNFVMARSPIPYQALVEGLKERGVLIRSFGHKRMLEECVRMTVGDEELNAMLLWKMEEVIREW
jgi:histidinol-phosphate aminotransferase